MRFLLGLLLALTCACSGPAPVQGPELDALDLAALASAFGPSPHPATARLQSYRGPVLVVLRKHGERVTGAWGEGSTWWDNLREAILQAGDVQADTAEVCLAHGRTPHLGKLGNVHLGVLGIELETPTGRARLAPTEMLARNLSFPRAIQSLVDTRRVPPDQVSLFTFRAEQALVQLENPPTAKRMVRGNQLVTLASVDRASLEKLAQGLQSWLEASLQPDGRMVYKYWPSRGEESPADNPLRQFMATWVLQGPPANLAYNLRKFGRPGEIEYRGEVKLGAMAIAALAILDSPEREHHRAELAGLVETIESLARKDGSFRTFLRPKKRENDNQNFYSGEAQLLRARLYLEKPAPDALERFMRSFRYYRGFFRKRPNPAFVPWHTRACALVYSRTRDPELLAFVYEMNDWLLGEASMQEWDESVYPDLQGRFYNARRPDYGPPHASSTGAFMEGLCEAYALAQTQGDGARAERYRTALLRGARDLMQLQFADDLDMFYVSRKDRVRGGLRTEVYNNELRVDNAQHALSAVRRLLEVLPQGQR